MNNNQNNKLISIIVPVYKVEDYLDKCIESLVSQTYRDIEIILVEDGSPDTSGQICDNWMKKDSRIKVIHQENSGAGAARNQALEIAKGNFVTFVDSDDYVSPNMYKYLTTILEENEDVDIVECGYIITENDDALFDIIDKFPCIKKFSVIEAMNENIRDHLFRQLIWNKIYRKEVVEGIFFPVGKKIDDEFWTYQVLGKARNLIHTDKKLYAYRQQENSVMHSMAPEKRLQAIEAKVERHKYICEHFNTLKIDSLVSLWFTCIYQLQIAKKTMNAFEYKNAKMSIKKTLRAYPIDVKQCNELSMKQKCWLWMANISIDLTCTMRNILKIGL